MRQRLIHELREAWYQLINWQLPSVDQLRSHQHRASTTLDLTRLGRGAGGAAVGGSCPSGGSGPGGGSGPSGDRGPGGGSGAGGVHVRSASTSAVVTASSRLGTLSSDVTRLCQRLMSRFVRRVTRDATTRLHVLETPHSRTASITSTAPHSPAPPRPDISHVFDQLEQILSFIGRALDDVSVTDETQVSSGRGQVTSGQVLSSGQECDGDAGQSSESLSSVVGERLYGDVLEGVYTDCLSDVVDSRDTSWPTLDNLLRLAQRFQSNISRQLHVQVGCQSRLAVIVLLRLLSRQTTVVCKGRFWDTSQSQAFVY